MKLIEEPWGKEKIQQVLGTERPDSIWAKPGHPRAEFPLPGPRKQRGLGRVLCTTGLREGRVEASSGSLDQELQAPCFCFPEADEERKPLASLTFLTAPVEATPAIEFEFQ